MALSLYATLVYTHQHTCLSSTFSSDVLAKFVTLVMVHAASADDAAPLIAIINKHIQQSPTSAALWTLLKICVAIRKGDRALASIPAVMDTITVMREAVICSENGATHREYLSTIVVFARILDIKHYTAYRTLIDTILRTASPALATALVKILVDVQWEQFTALLLPAVVAFIDRTFVESPKEMLLLIAYVLRMDAFDGNALSSCVGEGGRLRFAGESIGAYLVDTVANAASNVHSVIQQFNEAGEGALTTVVAALSCIPRVVLARNDDTAWAVVTKLVEATAAHMATSVTLAQQHGRVILFVRSLRASIALAGVHTDKLPCLWPFAISALHACSKNTALLETVHDYMVAVRTAMPAETFSAQAMLMLYSTLKQNLLSPDAALRLVTLRILSIYDAVPYVTADTADPSAIPTQPFFELLLTVERTPNTVECYREKLMHLRRIHSVVVANRQLPFTYVDIVPRFCCGLLTVNFQPVWEDAMKLLMAFGEVLFRSDDGKGVKGNEMLWDIWWTELQRSAEIVEEELSTHDCFALALASDHVDYIEQHDPRSLFGDISVCTITKMSWDASHFFKTSSTGLLNEALLESMASDTTAASRFDRANYHALLMRAVTTYAPKLAEARATSDFVPMFLAFYNGQYEKSHAAVTTLTSGVDVPAPTAPVKFLRKRLVLFLELFGKFRNPSATIKDPAMNFSLATIYHHLLTKNDPQLQRLALECLRTYRNEVVMHYADRLLALIEDATFRDELSALQSDTEIPAHHRHDLLRLVIRILFGKIVRQKAGASVGEGAASMRTVMARRSAVLGFLAGCQEDELRFFVDDLLLAPFNGVCDAHAAGGQFVFAEAACAAMTEVGHRTQIAYLHLLEDLCKQMGAFLSPYLDQMMLVLMYLLRGAQCTIDAGVQVTNPMDVDCNEAEEEEAAAGSTHLLKRAREIRSMALRRLADIFSLKLNNLDADEEGSACAFDFTPYMPALFEHILTPRIRLLAVENTQSPTALLDLLWAWSKSPVYVGYLATYDASLLPALFACLSAVNVKPAVVGRVLDVVEFILAKVEPTGESDLTVGQAILSPHVGALLDHLEQVLVSAPSLQSKGDMVSRDHLVQRQIRILSEMAQFTRKPAQLWRLVDLLLPCRLGMF